MKSRKTRRRTDLALLPLLASIAIGLAGAAWLPAGLRQGIRPQNLAPARSRAWMAPNPLPAASDGDLALSKTAALPAVTAGGRLTYTLIVTNTGSMTSTGSVVTDTLPVGTGYLSGSDVCSPGMGQVTCTLGTLIDGASQPLTIAVAVPASAVGMLTNTATVQGNEVDPNPINNTALVTTTVATIANLALTKSASAATINAGAVLTYTLTVSNTGPSDAAAVVVTDTLPAANVSPLPANSSQGSCTPLAGQVRCSLGVLAAGSQAAITLPVQVDSQATGSLLNSAVVAAGTSDPTPSNNTAQVTTTVTSSVDLALVKAASPDPVTAGAGQAYTLTVSNSGPSDSAGGVVTDTLPSGVSLLLGSAICTPSGGVVVCSLPSLAAGASRPVTLTVAIPPSATGVLTNTATVQGNEVDPNPINNTALVTTTVAAIANLALTKSASAATINAGAVLTYTLTVSNTGPSDAAAVVVTDTLPATGVSPLPANPSQGSCTPLTGQVRCSLGVLAAGSQAAITLPVQVDSQATGSLLNSAVVAARTSDPVPANNADSLNTAVTTSADLAISKNDSPDPVVAGSGVLTYTLTIDNHGPSEAKSVSVGDTLPPGVTLLGAVSSPGTCLGSVTCSLGSLDAGASGVVTITVTVSAGASSPLTNSAVVTSITPDPVGSNNSAAETTTVVREANLALGKTGAPNPVTAGTALTYTLAVTNTGPSSAAMVVLTDTLPAGFSAPSATPSQGSCSPATGLVRCDLGGLPLNGNAQVQIVGTVDQAAAGQLVNQAVVGSQATDPDPLNNSAVLTTTVSALADLVVAKAGTPNSLPPGGVLTYTVTVTNTGPSRAAGVLLNDILPTAVQLTSATPSQGSCSGTNPVACDFGDLDAGAAASAVLVVAVDSAAPEGTITNTAAALSSTVDPDLSNNIDSENTQLSNTIVDLAVTKVANEDPAYASSPLVYTLAVTNGGPSDATGVVVTDTLPAGVTFVSATPAGACSGTAVISCQLGGIAVGAQATAVLTVTIDSATSGVILNTAAVAGAEADSNTADNTDQILTTVIPQADLELSKADGPDPVVAGVSTLTYTLIVTNRGPSVARSLTLTDTLPSGLTLLSTNPPTCSSPPGPIVCSLPDLNAGASATLTLRTMVDSGASGMLVNQAVVTTSAEDPNPADNTASATTTVNQDTTPPTVTWVAPVTAGVRFNVVAARSVRLEVLAADNLGVEKVRFIRWDAVKLQYVQIGEDFSAPYTWDLDTWTLNPGWNQIFAQSFDLAGNASPAPPAAPYIWLYRWDTFLPLISR